MSQTSRIVGKSKFPYLWFTYFAYLFFYEPDSWPLEKPSTMVLMVYLYCWLLLLCWISLSSLQAYQSDLDLYDLSLLLDDMDSNLYLQCISSSNLLWINLSIFLFRLVSHISVVLFDLMVWTSKTFIWPIYPFSLLVRLWVLCVWSF